MNVRKVLSLALAIAFAGTAVPGPAMAQVSSPNGYGEKWWDPSRDDHSRWNRGDFEGRWLAEDRFGMENRGFRRMIALPNFLRIDQGRRVVRIADRQNNLLQVIAIENGYRAQRESAIYLTGKLYGSRLVAYGEDSRGRNMKQVLALKDRGRTLVVRMQVERGNSGRVFEFERTYHRA